MELGSQAAATSEKRIYPALGQGLPSPTLTQARALHQALLKLGVIFQSSAPGAWWPTDARIRTKSARADV